LIEIKRLLGEMWTCVGNIEVAQCCNETTIRKQVFEQGRA